MYGYESNGWLNICSVGRMDGWKVESIDGWMDGYECMQTKTHFTDTLNNYDYMAYYNGSMVPTYKVHLHAAERTDGWMVVYHMVQIDRRWDDIDSSGCRIISTDFGVCENDYNPGWCCCCCPVNILVPLVIIVAAAVVVNLNNK